MQGIIKRLWEKLYERGVAPPKAVHVVGPVYEQPTPYHNGEDREINPVKPADGKGVLFYNFLHGRKGNE